jgi:hypothetical protein
MRTPEAQDAGFGHLLHIAFEQPEKGEIVLFLSVPCKKLIVENIYGRQWDSLEATEIDDCLLELLNVLAGNYLNERQGRDGKHRISLPEMLFDDKELGGDADMKSMWFDAEGIPFRIALRLETMYRGG